MKKLLLIFLLLPAFLFGQTRPHWLQIQGKATKDVRDYGVKGDGSTDDWTALKSAFRPISPAHTPEALQ